MALSQAELSRASKRKHLGQYTAEDPKAAWRSYQPEGSTMAGRHSNAMEAEAMAATMEAEPVTDDQVTKARRTVVHQAMRANPDDMDVAITQAIETMKMLGIHSSQTPFTSPLLAPTVLNSMSSPSPVVRQK